MKLKDIYEDVFNRKDMPQVNTDDLTKAIQMLKQRGIDVKETTMASNDMKSSQRDLNTNKMKSIADDLKDMDITKMKRIVVSRDKYIVDGHHRHAALEFLGKDTEQIPVIMIMLEQKDALDAYNEIADEL
tara:strand:- start:1951 stop:2340 length:390 start_codon:yes stop_codon:yes gene_type:complete